jgi:hypothetical protein
LALPHCSLDLYSFAVRADGTNLDWITVLGRAPLIDLSQQPRRNSRRQEFLDPPI